MYEKVGFKLCLNLIRYRRKYKLHSFLEPVKQIQEQKRCFDEKPNTKSNSYNKKR